MAVGVAAGAIGFVVHSAKSPTKVDIAGDNEMNPLSNAEKGEGATGEGGTEGGGGGETNPVPPGE